MDLALLHKCTIYVVSKTCICSQYNNDSNSVTVKYSNYAIVMTPTVDADELETFRSKNPVSGQNFYDWI